MTATDPSGMFGIGKSESLCLIPVPLITYDRVLSRAIAESPSLKLSPLMSESKSKHKRLIFHWRSTMALEKISAKMGFIVPFYEGTIL